jgi:hypothetical protein
MDEPGREHDQASWLGNDSAGSELIVPFALGKGDQLPTLMKMPISCKRFDILAVV